MGKGFSYFAFLHLQAVIPEKMNGCLLFVQWALTGSVKQGTTEAF
jgi:hypothetical protein